MSVNSFSQVTFFVVEDHTLTSRGIRELLLARENFLCSGVAVSAREALQKLSALSQEESLPDFVILDLFLGKESGLDLLRVLRKEFSGIKIIVYSMYAKPGIMTLTLEAGADAFVEKSAPESELLVAVDKVLSGETYVQQSLISPLFTYHAMFDGLTRQEQNIFKGIIERKSNSEILRALNIESRTLENYLSRIYTKTGCRNREEVISKFGGNS